jgi:molecular chaperone GrpE
MSRIPIDDRDNDERLDQDGESPPAPAGQDDAQSGLDAAHAEADDLRTRLARVQADFQNARRRLEADKEQAVQYANANLIKTLLPVIDNFERALSVDAGKADATAILKGLQLVHDQLMAALQSNGVEVVAPQPGTPFDPAHQQALMQEPSDQYTSPTVTRLLQRGYMLHGRPLRPASVAVSKTT